MSQSDTHPAVERIHPSEPAITYRIIEREGVEDVPPSIPDDLNITLYGEDVAEWGWGLNAVLNAIEQRDNDHNPEKLLKQIGDTHVALYVTSATIGAEGVTTTIGFDPLDDISSGNIPFAFEDTFETVDGNALTFQDYPTDGLLFETEAGEPAQIPVDEFEDITPTP